MASTSEPAGASQIDMSEEGGTTSQAIMQSKIQEQTDVLPSSTPVEMSQLSQSPPPSHPQSDPTSATATAPTSAGASEPQTVSPISPSSDLPVLPGPAPTSPVSPTTPQTPAATTTTPAIGPGQDTNPTANTIHQTSNATSPPTTTTTTPPPDPGPSILITLILQTGKRHPFKIDLKYLRKRNIFKEDSAETDPFSISIYTLKELIWRDWREDWEARPTIPGNIRLIHFGKLLEDKQVLRGMSSLY